MRRKNLFLLCLLGSLSALLTWTSTIDIFNAQVRDEVGERGNPVLRPLRISIMESAGWHDEVTAALAYAFSQHPATAANLTLYLKARRFGIDQVYNAFLRSTPAVIRPLDRISDLMQTAESEANSAVDVLVLTSCTEDSLDRPVVLAHLFSNTRTHLFCVVHLSNRLKVESPKATPDSMVARLLPWIESKRITFLTLSPHVSTYVLTKLVPTWRNDTIVVPRVETFAPVFPVALADPIAIRLVMRTNATAFVMQGNFDAERRNYDAIMSQLQTVAAAKADGKAKTDLTLHLLGHGRELEIPKDLVHRVFVNGWLEYVPFYGVMSQSVAIVPAFATEEYYYERASSTVPASLIAGCPLVANRRLLSTYTYLDESMVWVQEEGETELDVVLRVALERSEDERRAIKERVRRRAIELAAKNVRDLVRWASEAKAAADAVNFVRWWWQSMKTY